MRRPSIIVLSTFIFVLSAGAADRALVRNTDGFPAEHFQATGKSAMVVTASPQASTIGVEILKKGGNAADAAIAVSFALGVTRPMSTGLGGGGFLLYYDAKTGDTVVFDFRETAPRRAFRDMYLRDGKAVPELSRVGHLSAGVPGTVAGLTEVHKRYGSLPLKDLIAPAIDLAREGIPVYPELARRIEARKFSLTLNRDANAIFFTKGKPKQKGESLVQQDLARTLEHVAEKGRDGFYKGPVAEAIAREMKRRKGLIDLEDLSGYRVKMRKPVRGKYRTFEIVSMPPPSSGGAHLVQMLNVLEGWNLRTFGEGTSPTLHRLAETMRQAYADRAEFMGDSDFVKVPLDWLTSREYANAMRKQVPEKRARKSADIKPGRRAPKESPSTTHFSIMDAQGNAVSSTQTINYGFGFCVIPRGTGVILNNEMDDFAAQPGVPNLYGLIGGEANAIAPGKRPLSSMTPTFVMRGGKPVFIFGSPGGSKIITTVLQAIVNVIDYEMPLYDAIAAPRMHHQWLPDQVQLEQGYFPEKVIGELKGMGHRVTEQSQSFGQIQAVQVLPDGTRIGASDPRVGGKAVGY